MEISILLLTYNHERYIEQALDSILKQKVDVSYEVIVLDDASTDNTQQILKNYKKEYPKIISLYLRKRNSCHPTRNLFFLMSRAKGKYIALLEGDDYWNDDLKLKKQYKFLEKYKEYSACVTDVIIVDKNNKKITGKEFYDKKENHIYTIKDFQHIKAAGMSGSLFLRNYFDSHNWFIIYSASPIMGDFTLFMLCILHAPLYQMDEKMAVYRYVSSVGENNFNSIQKENIYKDYMIVQYWIRLENYMKQHYKSNFEIVRIKEEIERFSVRYSISSMMHLIAQSENYRKYFLVYIARKFLLDSEFLLENHKISENYDINSWRKYIRDRRPVILFGAGAVAREYINKYAWQGNILFLVDNDTRKQNKSFKGFLIKKPDEIVKYSNIKILITIKEHEEEIRKQLWGIGAKDVYSYCSMQSCRLKNMVAKRMLQRCGDKINEGDLLKV